MGARSRAASAVPAGRRSPAVSAVNGCRYCVDAHVALVHAAGRSQVAEAIWRGKTPAGADAAALMAWARATSSAAALARMSPPFPAESAAEYFGTALVITSTAWWIRC